MYDYSEEKEEKFVFDYKGHELYYGEEAYEVKGKLLCRECFEDYIGSMRLREIAQIGNFAEIVIIGEGDCEE